MNIYKVCYEIYDNYLKEWISKSRDDIYYIEITAGEMIIKNVYGGEDIIYLKYQEEYNVCYSKVRNIKIEEYKEWNEDAYNGKDNESASK